MQCFHPNDDIATVQLAAFEGDAQSREALVQVIQLRDQNGNIGLSLDYFFFGRIGRLSTMDAGGKITGRVGGNWRRSNWIVGIVDIESFCFIFCLSADAPP